MNSEPSIESLEFLWKSPFMVDGGWIVIKPQEAGEFVTSVAEEDSGQVMVASSVKEAIERSDYDAILELQRELSWPWRSQALPSPENVVRTFRPSLGRVSVFSPNRQDIETELQSYGEFVTGRPSVVNRVLAEEFLFMKSSSTLLARNRRPFVLWRDRGKPILELARASFERKRTFMSRFPNLRFFVGLVLLISGSLGGSLAAAISSAGGAVLLFYDP